jgi:succinoglycan biosynthesis transport protein ExoP
MPQIDAPQSVSAAELKGDAPPTISERIDIVASFLRRRYRIILLGMIACLPLGALYHYITPASHTASTTVVLETQRGLLQESILGHATTDSAWIESQIGVLKSQNVAAYVVKQLRLAEDPVFTGIGSGPTLFEKALARLGLGSTESKSEAERVGAAISAVMSGLDIRRVGQSYLLRIDFRGNNPDQAAKIANAMVDAYIFDQLNAKYQATRRAGDWLQERLQTLREQASTAERAVIEFKTKNNIVSAGGTLMNDKQLSEISGRLASARARTSDVEARLDRFNSVRKTYQQEQSGSAADETVSEAMNNPIITKLRTQYLDLVSREADWSVKYGKNHIAVATLRNQIRDIRRSIYDEMGRIEETYKSEYEIAKKAQDELEKSLTSLISQSQTTNQAQVTLFSLEAGAQSYRKIYESFLQRHTEAVQQQSFPISEARQVSPASVIKTGPQALKIWLATIFAGGALGVGFGAFREIRDRGFRTREQVQSVLALECLALVPLLAAPVSKKLRLPRGSLPVAFGDQSPGRQTMRPSSEILRSVLQSPSSPFAEAIRSIKLTLDLRVEEGAGKKVIGLTSSMPGEGKSSIAAAIAAGLAQSGKHVILVDCDFRNPSLSRMLAPEAKIGFLDTVNGSVPFSKAVWTDPSTGMEFLPMVPNPASANSAELLLSSAAKSLFTTLQIKYDYVIVDLAPLVAGVEVRATSRLIDSYVLVVEWGGTKMDAVEYALRHAPDVQDRIAGVVLNKVDMSTIAHYDGYAGGYYYYGREPQRLAN